MASAPRYHCACCPLFYTETGGGVKALERDIPGLLQLGGGRSNIAGALSDFNAGLVGEVTEVRGQLAVADFLVPHQVGVISGGQGIQNGLELLAAVHLRGLHGGGDSGHGLAVSAVDIAAEEILAWEGLPGEQRPEKGLLRLRAGMGLYSNNRPARIWPQLAPASPLKPEIVAQGIDFIIVRELIGGVYFGKHETHTLENGEKQAIDSMPYSEHEIERIGRIGFETAQKRRKKLCCVDKANVLDTSRLWRSVMHRLQAEYPDVEYSEMFVDNCAMQIVKNPAQFDVIVTENMFGDILSDEASMITGSIGMIPSSSLGDGTRGLYEPIHGSAPDIAGRDIVNPTACILSAAMMLRYSFGMTEEADAIENAVNKVLDKGLRTADNMSEGCTCLGCTAMGDAILAEI